MIFRQFQDDKSKTFTYILAEARGKDAVIIDPVKENTDEYLTFIGENNLKLKVALDTHIHADHVTGLEKLREVTRCMTMMSKTSNAALVSRTLVDGDVIEVGSLNVNVLETPGHTIDSLCYEVEGMIFTGDTLFIRGNGRTDFQNGSPDDLYNSIHNKIFNRPDNTVIWPGHDYKGEHCTTVGMEKSKNPRLAGKSKAEFIEIMNNLNLPNPKLMDIAVPQNLAIGSDINSKFEDYQVLLPEEALTHVGKALFVDLRTPAEISETGLIEAAIQLEFCNLSGALADSGNQLTATLTKGENVIFYCAHGERSALAIDIVTDAKFVKAVAHLQGGIQKWLESGYKVVKK